MGAKRDPAPKIVRGQSKVFKNADEAVKDLKSGSTILSAGFGLCGTAGWYSLQWKGIGTDERQTQSSRLLLEEEMV